ncbi:MAG: hypothetical protein RSE41_00360 [Clostridia bacterium]
MEKINIEIRESDLFFNFYKKVLFSIISFDYYLNLEYSENILEKLYEKMGIEPIENLEMKRGYGYIEFYLDKDNKDIDVILNYLESININYNTCFC